ncbi:response regulator [Anaerofustis stercorihominis]|uniref:response regulator n=1 Tax=Anaerofustis stercorihominis TaxID=214853 RepID=UPI00214B0A65|nr:response regulator transcription factor [Anaerofustis stercorihominis]MCR2032491.1 response regulator transcription factor [Anaerofustis stercorihominis]
MNNRLILVVEDDNAVKNLISTTLESKDYKFHTAKNGKQALDEAISRKPDVILLDLGLPDMDGVDIIRKIRGWSNVPIIVVSARSEDKDKIDALDAGADDYLTKPFSVDELLARLRVAFRRLDYQNSNYNKNASPIFTNGGLKIDYESGCVFVDDKEVHLTPNEYKLICLLSKNVGKVLTHKYILNEIWGTAFDSDVASLRVYMATLRKKIEEDSEHPIYIQTHIGVGYRMLRIGNK